MTEDPFGAPHTPPGFQPPAQGPYDGGGPLAAPRRRPLVGTQRALAAAVGVVALVALVLLVRSFFPTEVQHASPSGSGTVTFAPELPTFRPTVRPSAEGVFPALGSGPVPKPVRYTGTGSKTIRLRRPEPGISLIYAKGDATGGRFYVRESDEHGVLGAAHLAEFGRFEVLQVFEAGDSDPAWGLRVEATGPWTIEIRSARSAPSFRTRTSGPRGGVVWYTGPAGYAAITGGSTKPGGSLAVHTYRPDGGRQGLVALLVDPATQRVRWPAGPVLVELDTDAPWSIRVS